MRVSKEEGGYLDGESGGREEQGHDIVMDTNKDKGAGRQGMYEAEGAGRQGAYKDKGTDATKRQRRVRLWLPGMDRAEERRVSTGQACQGGMESRARTTWSRQRHRRSSGPGGTRTTGASHRAGTTS